MSLSLLILLALLNSLALYNRYAPASGQLHFISKLLIFFFLLLLLWFEVVGLNIDNFQECRTNFITALFLCDVSERAETKGQCVMKWVLDTQGHIPVQQVYHTMCVTLRPHFIHNWLCWFFCVMLQRAQSFGVPTKSYQFSGKRKTKISTAICAICTQVICQCWSALIQC